MSFFSTPFGQTVIAAAAGGLATALPSLVLGDLSAARTALAATVGAVCTTVALHFKKPGAL